MTHLAWFAEALLEAAGCWLFLRRRIAVLWIWLGFRAAADLISFAILETSGQQAYSWADYIQRTVQYPLFAAACIYVAWRILRENSGISLYVSSCSALMVLAIARIHALWPPSPQSVLSFEVWAEMLLGAFVAVALGMANGRAPKPWGLIGIALVIMGGSDGLVTLLMQHGWHVVAWYPLGAIVGLGILDWAGWRDYQLEEARGSLGMKKPPTSVGSAEIFRMFG